MRSKMVLFSFCDDYGDIPFPKLARQLYMQAREEYDRPGWLHRHLNSFESRIPKSKPATRRLAKWLRAARKAQADGFMRDPDAVFVPLDVEEWEDSGNIGNWVKG